MSSKQLSLVSLGVALLVLVGLATFLVPESTDADAIERGSGTRELPAPQRDTRAPAAESEAALADVDASTSPTPLEEDDARSSVAEELTYAPADGRWIVGRVAFPAGVAAGDELEVFALTHAMGYARFAQLCMPQDEDEADEAEDALDDRPSIRSRAAVEPDGSFRIAVPEDEDSYLMLRGRYLYLPAARPVTDEDASPLTLAPVAGTCISLEVATLGGGPLGDARLEFDTSTEDQSFNPFTFADDERMQVFMRLRAPLAEGVLELRAVPVDRDYVLTALPEDWAAQRHTLTGLTALETRRQPLLLTPGGRIDGVVVDEAGNPIAGARVAASLPGPWFGFDDEAVREAQTGADGKFALAAVTSMPVSLRAEHDEYLESKKTRLEVAEGSLVDGVVLSLENGQTVSGRVTLASGEPVADVEVRASFDPAFMAGPSAFNALRGSSGSARSDSDGRFRLSGLGAGPFVLQCETEGAADSMLRARRDNVLPGTEDLELVLHPPVGLWGRVTDLDGVPLETFKIHATRQVESAMGSVSLDSVQESFTEVEDGAFLIENLIEGTWHLYGLAEGYRSAEPVSITMPSQTESDPILVAVTPTATISGSVVNPEGNPVGQAKVQVDTGQPSWAGMVSGAPGAPEARSEDDGTFLLEGVLPGTIALLASSETYASGAPVSLEVASGDRIEGVELTVIRGGRVTGEVYDDEGKLAAGMFVMLNSMSMEQRMSNTDAQGAFAFDAVPPGSWQVIAMDRSADWSAMGDGNLGDMMKSMKMGQANVKDGEEVFVQLGAPPADPIRVYGRVTLDDEPFGGGVVTFYPQGAKLYERLKFADIDERGEYEIEVDGPGDYLAIVQRLGGNAGQQQNIEFAREVPEQDEVRLNFELPLGRISGTVLGPDRKPASAARITLSPAGGFRSDALLGGQYAEIQTGPDGKYDLEALRPGKYTVSAGGAAFFNVGAGEARLGRLTQEVEVGEDQWLTDVDFQLQAPGSLEITVTDPSGAPAQGAFVFVRDASGRILEPFSMFQTDGAGRFEQHGLTPGEYTVTARQGSLVSTESAPVRVSTESTTKLALRIEDGAILWIRIRDKEGPTRASVRAVDSEGREWGGMFGMDDLQVLYLDQGFSPNEQRIGPLPPGKYRVYAEADGKSAAKPVTLQGGEERKLTVRLK